jgi:flagellar biosynthesis anti-sigma factor FlgM
VRISRQEAESVIQAYLQTPGVPGGKGPRAASAGLPGGVGQGGSAPTPASDQVSVSQQAADVRRWVARVASLPDVRQDVVDRIRQRIARGEYPPPAGDVAAQMIARWVGDHLAGGGAGSQP